MSTLGHAIAIASEAFKNKTDKGGKPYILHCLYVMNKVSHLGETAMIIAVLHDLLEDCPEWTESLLLGKGFSFDVVSRIKTMTKLPNEDYLESYIPRIASDVICKEIKKADLEHNSQITRIKGLTEKDFKRLQKYATAYTYLS
jgi:(p)ppGpp synthase/HD superfamily hydrolase